MNNVEITECKPLHLEELSSLLAKNKNYIPGLELSTKNLLLKKGSKIVGLLSLWKNVFHPYRDYISILIDPNQRQQGLAYQLFLEGRTRYSLKKLQTAFDSDDELARLFAQKCDFHLSRQTYCYSVGKEEFKPSKENLLEAVLPLSSLNLALFTKAINLQYEDYQKNHQAINPLNREIDLKEWTRIITNDLSMDYSFVLGQDNEIKAYLFSYLTSKEELILAYSGQHCSEKEYRIFLSRALKEIFSRFPRLELELDSHDQGAQGLASMFVSTKKDISWDTYTRDI